MLAGPNQGQATSGHLTLFDYKKPAIDRSLKKPNGGGVWEDRRGFRDKRRQDICSSRLF